MKFRSEKCASIGIKMFIMFLKKKIKCPIFCPFLRKVRIKWPKFTGHVVLKIEQLITWIIVHLGPFCMFENGTPTEF